MNKIKMYWGGDFFGTQYSISINNKRYALNSNSRESNDKEYSARVEAEKLLLACGIGTEEFNVLKEPFNWDGTL